MPASFAGAKAYSQAQQMDTRELVQAHLGLVKKAALHLMGMTGTTVSLDDLMQTGLLGLLEAAGRYDGGNLAGFRQFAMLRIRGAMIDELRQADGRPRAFREEAQQIRKAVQKLEGQLGRTPREREVAEEMGISIQEYQQMLVEVNTCHIVSLEDLLAGSDSVTSDNDTDRDALKNHGSTALANAIGQLPEREQLLLNLYYDHDMNMKEVAQVLEITEARVCQLHRHALLRLKGLLGNED